MTIPLQNDKAAVRHFSPETLSGSASGINFVYTWPMGTWRFNILNTVKIALIIGSILALAAAGVGWYLNQHWKKLLEKELPGYVASMSDSLYVVKFQHLSLDVLSGNLTLEKVSMVADTQVYHRLLARRQAPVNVYTVSADKLQLSHFKTWRYFLVGKLNAAAVTIINPDITLEQNLTVRDTTQPKTAWQQLSPEIKSLFIGKLRLDSTHFKYVFIRQDSSRVVHEFEHLSLQVNDLQIDSLAMIDPSRYLYAHNYEIGMKDYSCNTPDSLYRVNINGIRYDAAMRTLHIEQAALIPRYDSNVFQQKTGVQQDRYEVLLTGIRVGRLHPQLLLQEQQIWAKYIDISGGSIQIYRDRQQPMPSGNKLGKYPQQLLQRFRIPLCVDTLTADNMQLSYTELSRETRQTGSIYFNHIHGQFGNITNIDSMVVQNRQMTANFDAVFMSSGKLTARFNVNLNDPSGKFAVAGQLKDMNGKELNVASKPLGMIEIKSCDIDDLTFNIKGDERKAEGFVKLLYQNLKIAVLTQDPGSRQLKRKGLASLIANIMIINDRNPLKGEAVRTATVHQTRDTGKSFFNLVWKTLFKGVKDIAGAGNL